MSDAKFLGLPCDRKDCRLEAADASTTLLGWMPVHDRAGRQVNRDPNYSTTRFRCQTCQKKFEHKTGGIDLVDEWKVTP